MTEDTNGLHNVIVSMVQNGYWHIERVQGDSMISIEVVKELDKNIGKIKRVTIKLDNEDEIYIENHME